MSKGERHDLPLALKRDAASPTMEIKEARDGAPDRIEGDIAHARTKDTAGTAVLTELRQDSIIPGITLRNGEGDTDYGYGQKRHLTDRK
jgi:predicted ATPase